MLEILHVHIYATHVILCLDWQCCRDGGQSVVQLPPKVFSDSANKADMVEVICQLLTPSSFVMEQPQGRLYLYVELMTLSSFACNLHAVYL